MNTSRFFSQALAALTLPLLSMASAEAAVAYYTSGHADLGVAYEDGAFNFHFHGEGAVIDGVEVGDREYAASDIIIHGGVAATVVLPEGFVLPGLGRSAGDTVWILPWNQEEGLPFLGTASEELNPADWIGGITFTLGNVTSPSGNGEFALWRYTPFGEVAQDLSTVTGPNSVITSTGSHDHFNWGFTEPGLWEVELTASGQHATDGLISATETFRFQIVPEPSTALLGGLGILGLFARRRR
ncbi:choice-of-anchor M domain-containing protein [Luteolibacter sp. Populi]|uniref:choice-of-anchor M domain-containing protein n=1 Tax=Luteolibacter sp. Populi TaxID=3230487 RepID=UPI00346666F9